MRDARCLVCFFGFGLVFGFGFARSTLNLKTSVVVAPPPGPKARTRKLWLPTPTRFLNGAVQTPVGFESSLQRNQNGPTPLPAKRKETVGVGVWTPRRMTLAGR